MLRPILDPASAAAYYDASWRRRPARLVAGQAGGSAAEVRPIELFFDLVYVLAVTQLTHHLLDHLTLRGALRDAPPAARRLGRLELHELDDQLLRAGRARRAAGAARAACSRASRCPRPSRRPSTTGPCSSPARTSRSRIGRTLFALVGFGEGHSLRRVFTRPLVWWCRRRRALGRRRDRGGRRALRALGRSPWRLRVHGPRARLSRAAPRPHPAQRLHHRRRAHGGALPALHHALARRVDPDRRRQRRRAARDIRRRLDAGRRLHRDDRALVDLLRPQRRGREVI